MCSHPVNSLFVSSFLAMAPFHQPATRWNDCRSSSDGIFKISSSVNPQKGAKWKAIESPNFKRKPDILNIPKSSVYNSGSLSRECPTVFAKDAGWWKIMIWWAYVCWAKISLLFLERPKDSVRLWEQERCVKYRKDNVFYCLVLPRATPYSVRALKASGGRHLQMFYRIRRNDIHLIERD